MANKSMIYAGKGGLSDSRILIINAVLEKHQSKDIHSAYD